MRHEPVNLGEASVASLHAAMRAGRVTSLALVDHALARVETHDRSGPMLRAMLDVDPDARDVACARDEEWKQGQTRGPLHGIPFVVKANIDTADAMPTSAGSLALASHVAERDATVVERIRAAGGVLVGKTNLSEWANYRSHRSASGWSSLGGQTRNPYALDRTPCGSSSGSAVAVAAGYVPLAIGTETNGSITCPASVTGIVGFKPTVGWVSRAGIVPASASQDTAGPMARSVPDVAVLFDVIAGADDRDPTTGANRGRRPAAADAVAARTNLNGVRLGVARSCFGTHPAADAITEATLATLRSLGAEIVDGIHLGSRSELAQHERVVLLTELRVGLDRYFAEHPSAGMDSLADVVAFNRTHAQRVMPFFGQELLEAALESPAPESAAYAEARAACRRLAGAEGIDRAVDDHALDALVAPARPPAWVIDPIDGDRGLPGCSSPAAVAGYPHVVVPSGHVHGLPVGVSIFGTAYRDADILSFAAVFERATQARTTPTYRRSVT